MPRLIVWLLHKSRYVALAFTLLLIILVLVNYFMSVTSPVNVDNPFILITETTPPTSIATPTLNLSYETPRQDEELQKEFAQTPFIFEKFTMVTPTYKRTKNLPLLFSHYCSMGDIIHKIIILWNNVGEEVPEEITEQAKNNCEIPVVIKIMPKNNLTSRFIPYKEIETAGVLSVDDDLQLSLASIHLAFNTWKKYPYLLVGYTPRTYMMEKMRYRYRPNMDHGKYTMMMTNIAFIHRNYLELFTNTVPKSVVDFIIKTTNGEDITMNTVIGKYLSELGKPQCVAIYIADHGVKEIGNLSKSGYKGLWKRKGHMRQRSRCLNLLNEVYGQLYLKTCYSQVTSETLEGS